MTVRTLAYIILILWLLMLIYVVFRQENETAINYNAAINHNALSGNTIGILQTKMSIRNQSATKNTPTTPKFTTQLHNSTYSINNNPIYESNKNYRSSINYMATTAKLSNTKHKNEATATIAPLAYTNFALLVQTNYAHYSERKPFDNEQASFEARPQRAPFSGDPPFPSDPGDMGAPIGNGNVVLMTFGLLYIFIKFIILSKGGIWYENK